MAQPQNLNIEVLLEKAVALEISYMSDSNSTVYDNLPDGTPVEGMDYSVFENNLLHGFNVMSQMYSYMEACLNTILRSVGEKSQHNNNGDEALYDVSRRQLEKSQEKKLKALSPDWSQEQESAIKPLWNSYRELMTNVRSELLHYKFNRMETSTLPNPNCWTLPGCSALPDYPSPTSPLSLGAVLTETELARRWEEEKRLVALIAEASGCIILPYVDVLSCEGKDSFASYIVRKDVFLRYYPARAGWISSHGQQAAKYATYKWAIDPWAAASSSASGLPMRSGEQI